MRGTLVGSDYLKQGNTVKFLELNTNIAIDRKAVDYIETGSLMALLTSSGITDFHFIHMGYEHQFPITHDTDYAFAQALSASMARHNISYTEHITNKGAITVPYIEDSSTKFILRQSYDNTAIIDSTYAGDNFEFFELMSGSGYAPKSYFSSSLDDLYVDTLDDLKTGSVAPNLVYKGRYPSGAGSIALYKYTSSIDNNLSNFKNNLDDDFFLQEFIDDSSNIVDNRVTSIRGLNILYGDNLEVLDLGGYKHSSFFEVNQFPFEYSSSAAKLSGKTKYQYLTKSYSIHAHTYHTDEETVVLQSDGSHVSSSDMQVNDNIKTIVFDFEVGTERSGSVIVENDDFLDHYGYIRDITGSMQYVTSSLDTIEVQSSDHALIRIHLNDGTSFVDPPRTSYLIEESGSDLTYFEFVNKFLVGDKVGYLDTTTNTIALKTITSSSIEWGSISGSTYNLDFEPYNYFLTHQSGNQYLLSHNPCNYCGYNWSPCGTYWCSNDCPTCDFFPGFK